MNIPFQDCVVDPDLNQIRRDGTIRHLEPLTMNVLVCLLENVDQVISTETLLDRCWAGRHAEPGMVARCVQQIRRALGDDARSPRYLETIRKRGYRAIGTVAVSRTGVEPVAQSAAVCSIGIGVIPFDDLSPGGGNDWLAHGISEELIEYLGRIPGLHVPARNSVLVLKQQNAGIDVIAKQLKVTTIVDGSVRRINDRITVVVRWTRVSDQARLWSARFERPLADVLAVQREIAIGVAEAIRQDLSVRDAAVFLAEYRYQARDVRAWELFRRGFDLASTFLPERMEEGRALIRQALAQDPNYLAAKVILAWSDFDRPDARVRVAQEVLERDPTNVFAYSILIDDSMTRWDFATAQQLWERAAAQRPHDNYLALSGYHVFSGIGDLRRTLEVTRHGVHIDPLYANHQYFHGMAHLQLGDPQAAVGPLETAVSLFPVNGMRGIARLQLLDTLAVAYHLVGREEDACEAVASGHRGHEETVRAGWKAAGWVGVQRALAIVRRTDPGPAWSSNVRGHMAAQAYALAGAREEMYVSLEELMRTTARNKARDRAAYRDSCFLTKALNAPVAFQPYRREPRFRRLKRALDARLAGKAWTSAQSWK